MLILINEKIQARFITIHLLMKAVNKKINHCPTHELFITEEKFHHFIS